MIWDDPWLNRAGCLFAGIVLAFAMMALFFPQALEWLGIH